mmetsp:Transcript_34332/g.106137  ORF Transcript_34332/g.106137 Transcript_34332/m.106137 type:complete len:98 (+) Transcript_34332:2768-3061(+)
MIPAFAYHIFEVNSGLCEFPNCKAHVHHTVNSLSNGWQQTARPRPHCNAPAPAEMTACVFRLMSQKPHQLEQEQRKPWRTRAAVQVGLCVTTLGNIE